MAMDDATRDNQALFEAVVFLHHFNDLPDPRQRGKVTYPLDEILLLALLAVLAGAESFVEIARFGEKKLDLLRRFRPFRDGTPSGSVANLTTIRRDLFLAREEGQAMSDFKGRHFEGEIVLWAVRWYCRYGVSYRDLEQMMGERVVSVDHSTIYRWVQRYAPEIEKRLRWPWRGPRSASWRIDETYVKVRGQWTYLYRAIDKHGNTIDFYLSPTRDTAAAKRFLGKALNGLKDRERPRVINTDKAPTYAAALAELKKEGKCSEETLHRQIKYLNNII
jgi:transposase-like protein